MLQKWNTVREGRNVNGGEEIRRWRDSPTVESRLDSGGAGVVVDDGCLEKLLMRGRSCGSGLQALGRGGVAWSGWSKAFAPAEQWGGEG